MLVYVVLLNTVHQPWHIITVSTDFKKCEDAIERASSYSDYIDASIECWDAATEQFEGEW